MARMIIGLGLTVYLVLTSVVQCAVIHIPGDHDTIADAVAVAVNGDTIVISDGVYSGSGNRDITFTQTELTIQSENGYRNTIIDLENAGRAFEFPHMGDIAITIDGLWIKNGSSDYGGAISIVASTPVITNCFFDRNTASAWGGALFVQATNSAIIHNCIFENNHSDWLGGGMVCDGEDNAHVSCCEFYLNNGMYGSGLTIHSNSNTTVTNCFFGWNQNDYDMGSLRVSENSSPAITNCTIIGSIGNGFVCDGETCAPVLRNCIFLYNNPMDFSVVSGNPEIHFSITEDEWTGTGVQNTIEKPIYVPGPPNMYYLSSGYYLSHQAAQQTYDSPGIDQGSGPADSICFQTPAGEECLGEYTTRSDLKSDTGVVDIGYHPPTKQWVPIETYVSIDKLIKMLKPGFECAIYTRVYNADEETLTDYPLFVILEIAGTYFFAPSFGDYDSYNREFVTGTSTVEVLPPFEWPEGAGNFDSAFVYAALVLPDISDLYGDMDVLEFGWSEE